MYEWASEALEAAGYSQYEISNWGKSSGGPRGMSPGLAEDREPPHFACKHNLQYWRCLPYLGLGAGAHGYANGFRYSNVLRIRTYIERMHGSWNQGGAGGLQALAGHRERGGSGLAESERTAPRFPLSAAAVNQHRQTGADDMSEFMITGLRLTREGISSGDFRGRFGRELMEVYGQEISDLIQLGLLAWVNGQASEPVRSSEALRLSVRGRLLGNQVFMRFV
jgi:oxygen-independent coproporphyrinogen-3 oxidase